MIISFYLFSITFKLLPLNFEGETLEKNKFISWDEDKEYSLVSGGLVYFLFRKLSVRKERDRNLLLRALIFSLIAWLPLIILSLADGTFLGEEGNLGVAQDFVLHIRLLLIVPFLIWIEKLIDPAFNIYMNATRRLIPPEEEPVFKRTEVLTDKLSNSWLPEILFLVIIYVVLISKLSVPTLLDSRFAVTDSASNFNPSALYYMLISFPIYQFLIARWFWRWVIWIITVLRFSRISLRIEASHADQMAGMSYLSMVPIAFCILSLALSALLAGLIGEEIIYLQTSLLEYRVTVIVFVIAVPLVIYAPLLVFVPQLLRAKVRAIARFGGMIQYHNNLYREKWLEGNLPDHESILPSLDNSSMADINGSYQQAVKGMTIIPVERKTLLYSMLLLLIPFVPLIFTMFSMSELFSKLLELVTG